MREAAYLQARQARGVDERGVVQPVLVDNAVAFTERDRDAEIGHVTGGEQQCALGADKRGQLFLQRMMRAQMAAHEMRAAPLSHASRCAPAASAAMTRGSLASPR